MEDLRITSTLGTFGSAQSEPLIGAGLSQLGHNNSRLVDLIERASQIAARVDGNGPSPLIAARQTDGPVAPPTRPSRMGLHGALEDSAEETSTLLDELSNLLTRISSIV